MTQEPNHPRPSSLFERFIGGWRPWWLTAIIAVVLLLAPLVALALDGLVQAAWREGFWRILLVPPVLILYIFLVGPPLDRMGRRVIDAFRSLTRLDAADFETLVEESSRVHPLGEIVAMGLGAAFGLWMGFTGTSMEDSFWTGTYMIVGWAAMFGLLAWTIYGAVAGTRLTNALHRQPLSFDILDPSAFEPMGRYSLATTLVFIGGIVLSMLLGLTLGSALEWQTWVLYSFLIAVALLVFFLNMRPTHRVLAAARDRELAAVEQRLRRGWQALMAGSEGGGDAGLSPADRGIIGAEGEDTGLTLADRGAIGAEVHALIVYRERLEGARTWPYNTAMLRTLFFALVIPALAEGAKLLAGRVFSMPGM
jgi:hypothetical protein